MEIQEINNDVLKKLIKCEEGEFIFVTYDSTKDPDMTSDALQDLISYCQDNGCKCLCLPETNDKIAVALQDYDAEALRRLEGLVHQALLKKSKLILPN
jgi:hypothetical protein